jgi:hypothetical protein
MKLLMQAESGYIVYEQTSKLYLVERKRVRGLNPTLWVSHPQAAMVLSKKGAERLAKTLAAEMNPGSKLIVGHALILDEGDVLVSRLDCFMAH